MYTHKYMHTRTHSHGYTRIHTFILTTRPHGDTGSCSSFDDVVVDLRRLRSSLTDDLLVGLIEPPASAAVVERQPFGGVSLTGSVDCRRLGARHDGMAKSTTASSGFPSEHEEVVETLSKDDW